MKKCKFCGVKLLNWNILKEHVSFVHGVSPSKEIRAWRIMASRHASLTKTDLTWKDYKEGCKR